MSEPKAPPAPQDDAGRCEKCGGLGLVPHGLPCNGPNLCPDCAPAPLQPDEAKRLVRKSGRLTLEPPAPSLTDRLAEALRQTTATLRLLGRHHYSCPLKDQWWHPRHAACECGLVRVEKVGSALLAEYDRERKEAPDAD